MTKPWVPLADALLELHGNTGVFQLADAQGEVGYIGMAGGRTLFGLKGEVRDQSQRLTDMTQVRWEVTTAYHSRYKELLMVHEAQFGKLPQHNAPVRLGRISIAD